MSLRLNEKTYPAYRLLEEGEILKFPMDTRLANRLGKNMYHPVLEGMQGVFSMIKNKFYITDSFFETMNKSVEKIKEAMGGDESLNSTYFKDCLLMHKNGFAMHQMGDVDGKKVMRFYVFNKEILIGVAVVDATHQPFTPILAYISNDLNIGHEKACMDLMMSYMTVVYFISECEVETKVIKPKEKTRIGKLKYYNESKSPITILDCTWFTELIINSPFGVRGHLRWQPCGEGKTKKKLIWIEAFEKKGYHRKAKVDTDKE